MLGQYSLSPQVIIVRGQMLPLWAATLHWLRRRLQQQQQLMRESSPLPVSGWLWSYVVYRLRAVE